MFYCVSKDVVASEVLKQMEIICWEFVCCELDKIKNKNNCSDCTLELQDKLQLET